MYIVYTIEPNKEESSTNQGHEMLEKTIGYAVNIAAFHIRHAKGKHTFDSVPRDRAEHPNDVFQIRVSNSDNEIVLRVIVRKD